MTWHISRGESGATSRGGLIFAGGLALAGIGVGCVGVITGGGGGTTTTTTLPTTTSTASTTTTTIGGGDPCAAANPGNPGFPCTANTGVHGVTFTAANTTANNGSTCTVCPPGMTWSSGAYQINSCVTIDRWKINGYTNVNASNGNHPLGLTEAQTAAQSCVKLTNDLFAPVGIGKRDDVVIDVGFTGGGKGPVYLADSEVFGTNPAAAGSCSGGYPCNSGFSYTVSDTNLHLWRDYLHGTAQGLDSDGYSEMHDSYGRADRSDQMTINLGGSTGSCSLVGGIGVGYSDNHGTFQNCSGHGDAFFQDSGGNGPWEIIDHNTLFCGAQMLFCARDGAFFGDQSAPDGGIIKSNLFKGGNGVSFCLSSGETDGGANKPHPVGVNLTIKNNVFENTGGACTHTNAVFDATGAATALSHNNHWCNNKLDDGTLVNAAYETGSCP